MKKMILALCLVSICSWAVAFESWEHKRLGDIAYHFAVEIYCEKNKGGLNKDKPVGDAICGDIANYENGKRNPRFFFDPYSKDGNVIPHVPDIEKTKKLGRDKDVSKDVSYGDVVMCVDYFVTAEKLLSGQINNLIKGKSEKDTSPKKLYPEEVRDLNFNVEKYCDPSLTNFSGIQAGHINHNHFQSELMIAQRSNHLLALAVSSNENNLFGALALNAISDHFLHDSFSPGHLTTWRSRLTDTASNAYHDRNNQVGWDIVVKKKEFLEFVHDQSFFDDVLTKMSSAANQIILKDFLYANHLGKDDACKGECVKLADAANIDSNRVQSLQKLHQEVVANASTKVMTKGDQFLWNPSQDRQRMIMLLAGIRSVLDILQSRSYNVEFGDKYRFIDMTAAADKKIYAPFVDSFAHNSWAWHFDDQEEAGRALSMDLPSSTIAVNLSIGKYEIANKKEDDGDRVRDWVSYKSLHPIYGIGFGVDVMNFGDGQTRKILNFESFLHGQISSQRFMENHAVVAGLQYYAGQNLNGFALAGRYFFIRPEIETALSIEGKVMRMARENRGAAYQPSIGLRVDLGLTSFLTSYFHVSYDAAMQKDNSIRKGMSYGAGVQLVAPFCRMPFWSNTGWCS